MADRTVNVRLNADIDGYLRNMDKAKEKAKTTAEAIEQHAARNAQTYTAIGMTLLTIGTLAAAGIGAAITKYAEFDQSMSRVQAATRESSENMGLLRQAALDAGSSTVFSATEAAAAIEELGKAGLSTQDILGGGLAGALDLAAAGGLAVADAAETMATTLSQFSLEGEDAVLVADLLAAGAGKAQGGVEDLGAALNQSGLVASQMGLSVEETTGALTAFASAGLLGSDAGTSFRSMLMRLSNPTGEAAEQMEALGISAYDAQGNFVGMESIAGQLQDAMGGLDGATRDAAMATIFGSDAVRAANVLYTEGEGGIRNWITAVDDQGYAAEQARIANDNLKGDLEALSGAIETLMITIGAGSDGPLRALVQGFTDLVNGFNELDPVSQNIIITIGGVLTAATLLGGGVLITLPKIAAFRTALSALNITAGVSTAALAGLAAPLAIGGVLLGGLGVLAFLLEDSRLNMEDWNRTIADGASAAEILALANQGWINTIDGFEFDPTEVTNYLDQLERIDESNGWASFLPENWDVQFTDFSSRLRNISDALTELEPEEAAEAFQTLAEGLGLTSEDADRLLAQMPDLAEHIGEVRDEADDAGREADTMAGHVERLGQEAETAAGNVRSLAEEQQGLTDEFFRATDVTANYEQTIDDIEQAFADAAAQNVSLAASWDATTNSFNLGDEAGRNAHRTMEDLITSGNAHIQMLIDTNAPSQTIIDAQNRLAGQVQTTATRFDSSGEAALGYRDRILQIPGRVLTEVELATANADAAARGFLTRWDGSRVRMYVDTYGGTRYQVGNSNVYFNAQGNLLEFMASGGLRAMSPIAQMVPPNTWRVVGDRSDVDEAYIPIDGSRRSMSILDETIRRMSALAPYQMAFANGGIAQSPTYNPTPIINFAAPANAGGEAPVIGSVTFQADGSRIQPQIDQVMHTLRTYRRGGRR